MSLRLQINLLMASVIVVFTFTTPFAFSVSTLKEP